MFDEIFSEFSDSTVYFVMGSVGTALFLIKAALMLIGGDGDLDIDVEGDGGIEVHSGGFSLFSLLSILAFMMGAGWMGLLCREEFELGSALSAVIACSFGFALMLFASLGMLAMLRLQQSGKYDIAHSLGKIAKVYLTIPEAGRGTGQIQINLDGRSTLLTAVSSGAKIESFASVKVIEVRDDEVVIVERV
jgi:membrane-bound ClpP family serine protease